MAMKICTPVSLKITLVRLNIIPVSLYITQVSLDNALVSMLRLALNDGDSNTIQFKLKSLRSAVFISPLAPAKDQERKY